ncbi:hypothetical protein CKAH01_12319 [Colletotrichum kahawae]|uniref:Uncharacterized protein n=1 Tax=Colletotrichum kahawae TaxID=34407 RepID=A0AAD9YUK3_COLKA|nr:hypothetical protein CKAH01_12319 [Colletotrichum kahawae]
MQQGQDTGPETYDDDDDDSATDEEFDQESTGTATADEDDELSEDWLLALGQWASRICYVCQSFLNGTSYSAGSYWERKTSVYHASLVSLKQSVHAGCPLCRQLSISLDKLFKESELGAAGDAWHVERKVDTASDVIGGSYGMRLLFYLFDDEGHLHRNASEDRFEEMEFYEAEGLCLGPEFLGNVTG